MRKLFVPTALVLVSIGLVMLFAVNSGLRLGYANETRTVHVRQVAEQPAAFTSDKNLC
ncbi:MAG TPA: hypothetical protein VFA10_20985 [Ktedonobacteraceae bacterium]|nr:hypothetical protein [Ktedonobacteraceae bacterium]